MNYPHVSLEGAVVLVTGAARGIGRVTARYFAEAGAQVYAGDVDGPAQAEAARAIGPRVVPRAVDVTRPEAWRAWIDAVLERHGRVDVLVNNAGVMPLGAFADEADHVSRTTLDVNVWGSLLGARAVLPHMSARGRGHVVNVVSMAGKLPIPGMAAYNASKFGALGLSLALREEYAPRGVSVSAVLPAVVRTELAAGVPHAGLPTVDPEVVARAVVDSVQSRAPQIAVPRYLIGWDLVAALVPERALRAARRWLGGDRALHRVDVAARAAYMARPAWDASRAAPTTGDRVGARATSPTSGG